MDEVQTNLTAVSARQPHVMNPNGPAFIRLTATEQYAVWGYHYYNRDQPLFLLIILKKIEGRVAIFFIIEDPNGNAATREVGFPAGLETDSLADAPMLIPKYASGLSSPQAPWFP